MFLFQLSGAGASRVEYRLSARALSRQWGRDSFSAAGGDSTTDLLGGLKAGEDDLVADIIEAIYLGIRASMETSGERPVAGPDYFASRVNQILREERVAFELIEGQMVDLESEELHAAVVAPTLRLLSGRADFEGVERMSVASLKSPLVATKSPHPSG
jgi:hypothetical protein